MVLRSVDSMKLKLAVLGIGVFAILSAVMHVALSTRGAIPFIYNFHGIVLAVVVTASTTILWALLRRVRRFRERNAFVLCILYVVLTLTIWLPLVPVGDFVGGMLKYLRKHPVKRLSIAGGFAKFTKLAQGAMDLHSGRSQVDLNALATILESLGANPELIAQARSANTALDVLTRADKEQLPLADAVAEQQLRLLKKQTDEAANSAKIATRRVWVGIGVAIASALASGVIGVIALCSSNNWKTEQIKIITEIKNRMPTSPPAKEN